MKLIHSLKSTTVALAVGVAVLNGLVAHATTYVWTNSIAGSWNTAALWSPNGVPGAADTAIITNASASVYLSGVTSAGAIILGNSGGGASLLSLNGQTLNLYGPLTVNVGGQFAMDSGVLVGNNGAVLGGPGLINWVGSLLGGVLTLASGSTMNIVSANYHDMPNCTFTNNGTVVWNNGPIRSGGGGTAIYNYGLWDAQNDQVLTTSGYGGAAVFNNYGMLRKSGGASELANNTVFTGGVLFNQLAGVIDVQNGTNGLQLNFQGGGNLTGGYITTNSQGLTVLNAGNFTVNGTVTGTNTWQDAGTLVGNNVIKGALTWVNGVWNNAASVTITANTTLIVAGENGYGSGYNDLASTVVTNNGTVKWASGQLRGGGSGTTIYNYGLWDAQSDQVLTTSGYGGGAVFNNYGMLRKSGGASELANNTVFAGGVLFNQLAGVIDVQNGTNGLQLNFQGGGNLTGGYITTNSQGLTVLGAGNFIVNGTVTGTNTWQDAGTLVGNNVINGALTWVNGVWNGAASVTISPNTMLIVAGGNGYGSGYNDFASTIVTNNGTVVWASGQIRSGGAGTTIYNYGLWDAQSDQVLTTSGYGGGAVFNNYGTFRKSGGASEFANATVIQSVVFNQLAGVIDVQNGTNGLELAFQGGGNFTGGYITTNKFGLTVLSIGGFTVNGTVTGTNTWENNGNLVGTNVINGALTWVGGVWNGAVVTITNNSTVIVAGGGGVNDLNAAVVSNFGTVAWASGQLRGGNGAIVYNYGLWDAQSDLQLNSAYGGATVFNNYGTFRKSGGINTLFAGNVLFNQPSGVLDVQLGNVVLQGGANFTGGYITTNSTGTTYFSIGSFNLNGTATGTNVVENYGNLVGVNVIKGALTWVAGNWNSAVVTIANNSTVIVAGGGGVNDMANTIVTNNGTVAWTSGQIRGGSGAGTFIYNYGLWDAQCDQQMNAAFGAPTVFNNFGTFRKSAGTGNTVFAGGVLFNQTIGLLNVQSGNMLLQGSGNFTGGSISNNFGGTAYLNAGSFNINGTTTIGNVIENAGNLVGNNVINGNLSWVAGNWNGAVVTITTNSVVTVAGGGGVNDMANTIVTNNGTVAWASGQIRGGSGAGTFIYNYGLWDAQSDQQMNAAFGAPTVFNNFGTFRKEFTSGSTYFAGGVTFNNTGKLDAQDGDITLAGAYTLANGTKMGFGLGGWLGNGSISLSGAASFSGSVSVNINGYFWPVVGSSFNLLNYTSETGLLFTNTVLPPPFTWQTNYNPTAFAVSVLTRPAYTNTASTNLYSRVINGPTLYLAWPGDHTGWRLQSQTNTLNVGINTNWAIVPGSSVTNEFFMPIVKTNSTVFYRMIYP
jgi:hypothetical protein